MQKQRDFLGTLKWSYDDDRLEIKENFTQNGALEVQLIDPKVFSDESLVGQSTNDVFGFTLLDQSKKEVSTRKLGTLDMSIEDETGVIIWLGAQTGGRQHI